MTSTVPNFFQRAGNHALNANPPTGLDMHLTKRGSDWLWAVFSVFGVLLVIYTILFFVAELKNAKRMTRYALAAPFIITLFEFFGYFIYASNLGWTGIQAEFNNVKVDPSITGEHPGVRQIFYAKYIAWFLSWPSLLYLIELVGISTTSESNDISAMDLIHSLLVQIIGTEFWIVSLLIGALMHSSYKWGPFVFGVVTMLIMQFLFIKRQIFDLKVRGFTACMYITANIVVWLYFICWGLADAGNKIQNDGEAVFYGVLDICLFVVLPAYLLFIEMRYGKVPFFSLKKDSFNRDEENEENEDDFVKESAPNSIRASGETAVPDIAARAAQETEQVEAQS
ncbi:hypothetical protein KAFR_0B03580 [Kazachstania africana CBS 2517]|uniref:30 kDa heat shock protein n=1 Tax=Kazachstania africana (strain ATCC 22294 / BCRC 22015 / CBS 2517 / CECT 1963 / NBRC 1671 / NRRL Y-8276) TaxID=1071382 RepID=H2AQK5_KAZAF|nr:hypothetical protein KAFR_0B03580 [Kazachstania africana CBS 2517]CCF56655.1 hypothetical protein KAFR_0B03580 [Kazachstania africana CBS 2517]